MRTTALAGLMALIGTACSGLSELDADLLRQAESSWASAAPERYRLLLEVKGTRVEEGTFEVYVNNGNVVGITLDGSAVNPERTGDYSIEGLFGILEQELALADDPRVLGAPEGYQAYLLARFDPETGRLEHYRRSVGGASNSIDIEVLEFEAGASQARP